MFLVSANIVELLFIINRHWSKAHKELPALLRVFVRKRCWFRRKVFEWAGFFCSCNKHWSCCDHHEFGSLPTQHDSIPGNTDEMHLGCMKWNYICDLLRSCPRFSEVSVLLLVLCKLTKLIGLAYGIDQRIVTMLHQSKTKVNILYSHPQPPKQLPVTESCNRGPNTTLIRSHIYIYIVLAINSEKCVLRYQIKL